MANSSHRLGHADEKAQKRFQQAVTEGADAVAKTLAGASRKAIRDALVIELKRRGFADFEPPKDLIDRIRAEGRRRQDSG